MRHPNWGPRPQTSQTFAIRTHHHSANGVENTTLAGRRNRRLAPAGSDKAAPETMTKNLHAHVVEEVFMDDLAALHRVEGHFVHLYVVPGRLLLHLILPFNGELVVAEKGSYRIGADDFVVVEPPFVFLRNRINTLHLSGHTR